MDAATEWIAPYWGNWPTGSPAQAAVYILNPGRTPATVTVRFNYSGGELVRKVVWKVYPRQLVSAVAGASTTHQLGWVHIRSDQPILPWGRTPVSALVPEFVPMGFYRQNVALRGSRRPKRKRRR